jgi:hypothetical protein
MGAVESHLRQDGRGRVCEGRASYLFAASVFSCIGVLLRDGPWKSEPLTVPLEFQLSVLAELSREAASFPGMVDPRLSARSRP